MRCQVLDSEIHVFLRHRHECQHDAAFPLCDSGPSGSDDHVHNLFVDNDSGQGEGYQITGTRSLFFSFLKTNRGGKNAIIHLVIHFICCL